jgi:hypothetical protein
MTVTSDAEDAWWPPTLTPSPVSRSRFAASTIRVASHRTPALDLPGPAAASTSTRCSAACRRPTAASAPRRSGVAVRSCRGCSVAAERRSRGASRLAAPPRRASPHPAAPENRHSRPPGRSAPGHPPGLDCCVRGRYPAPTHHSSPRRPPPPPLGCCVRGPLPPLTHIRARGRGDPGSPPANRPRPAPTEPCGCRPSATVPRPGPATLWTVREISGDAHKVHARPGHLVDRS